ncbi:Uncharacterized protein GBIM_07185 [Gryllus bimaculatus]|nr:Uncharacterized protein GBIM_07185 [Gryllus bimaculatus]
MWPKVKVELHLFFTVGVVDSRVCNAADGRAQATSRRQLEVFRQQGPGGSFQVVRTSSTSVSSSSSSSTAAAAASARLQLGFDNLQVSRICRQLHVEAQRAAFGPSASRLLGSAAAAASDVDDAYDDDDSDAGVVIQEVSDSDSGHAAPQQQQQEEEEEEVERPPASAPSQHPPAARRRSSSTEDLQQQEEGSPRVDEHPAWTRASQVRRSLQFPARTSQERESSPTQRPLPGRLFPEDSKLFEGGKLKGLEALESVFRRGANIAESVNKSMTHDHEHSDASNADSLANHLRNESISRSSQSFNMDGFMRRNTTNTTNNSNASKRHSFVTVESLKEVRGRLRPLNSPSDEEPKQQKSILKPSKDEDDQDDGIVTDDHVKHPDSDVIADVPPSKVKSYILGMEVLANNNRNGTRKPVLGTGSLESRTSNRSSSSSNNRSEEWYNRRKSYGFEQVHAPDATENSRPTRLWEKNRVESSTDSGICRSSEAVAGPPWNRTSPSKIEEGKAFDSRKPDVMKISHSIQIKKQEEIDKISENGEMKDEDSPYQRGRRTIVTLGNEYNKSNSTYKSGGEDGIIVHNSIIKDTSSVSLNGYRTSSEDEHRFKPLAGPGSSRDVRRQSEPVTITIPIVSEDGERETSNVESKRLFFRQLSEGTSLSIESADRKSAFTNGTALKDSFKRGTWNGGDDWANVSKAMDNEMKRHSIAVDESKYVREGIKRFSNLHDTKTKELANVSTSELVKRFAAMHAGKKEEPVFSNKDKFSQNPIPSGINVSFVQNGESFSNDDQNKKHKKVEFCKTEVHFAAESGRVNIVETDEKPPPSNPIRRRRRSVAGSLPQTPPDASKSSLPEIRFGDSPYEKKLLGGNETESAEAAPMPVIVKPEPTRPTVLSLTKFQNDCEKEDQTFTQANATIAQSLHQESTISAYSETVSEHISVTTQPNEPMPRSILKNNRKPKPFILGESSDSPIETNDGQEEKWGVRLRPVQSSADPQGSSMWRSTVTLRSTAFDSVQPPPERKDEPLPASIHGNGESELQKMLKALRPAGQRRSNSETDSSASPQCSPIAVKKNIAEPANNSVQVTISSPPTDSVFSGWSVADRIKHVEELKQSSPETKGYSTRINFGSGEPTIIESGSSDDQQNASLKHSMGSSLFQKSDKCKPMWLRREEKKQELQDAKNSNKGLVVRIGKAEPLANGEVHSSLLASPDSSGSEPEGRAKTTTTTITIDLSPSPHDDPSKQVFGDVGKIKSGASENLQSPSLIMKTIHNPTFSSHHQPREASPRAFRFDEPPKAKKAEAAAEAKRPERGVVATAAAAAGPPVAKRCQPAGGAEGAVLQLATSATTASAADEGVRSYMSAGGGSARASPRGAAAAAPARASPTTVSVVSGSWSRVRAFRHVQQSTSAPRRRGRRCPGQRARARGRSGPRCAPRARDPASSPGLPPPPPPQPPQPPPPRGATPAKVPLDELGASTAIQTSLWMCFASSPEQGSDDASIHQVSVASAMLPSYDPNRIRRVETLVSTRSGQPKITSIALRYEGDRADDRPHKQSAFSTSTYTQQQQHSAWKNLDAANSYPPRNEEPSVGFTYYKPSDAGRSQALDERRDRTFKIDKHNERLHIEEKTTREKVSPNREQLFTSERRASSPNDSHLRATSPAQNRRPTSYPSAQKPSSPCPRYDSDRERSLSPASKRQPKAATYFGEVNSRSSAYSSAHAHRQESPRKAEGSRGSYERKGEERSRQRPSSDSAPSGHQRQAVESLTNGLQRSRVETSTREERRRSSYESSARSRSTSRGRSLSPSKARDGRKQPTAPPPQPAPALADGYDSPIYENIDEVLEESAGARRVETDSAILEELTRAADQILQAVNGYTDEDSRASSDDDDGGRRCVFVDLVPP